MKSAKKKPTAARLQSWRVIIMRSRGELLGYVEALDRERAEAVAIKLFELDDDQRPAAPDSGAALRPMPRNACRRL
jgi:hypothetical protein